MTENNRHTDPIPTQMATAAYIKESTQGARNMTERKLHDYIKAQPSLKFVGCYAEDCADVVESQAEDSDEMESRWVGGNAEENEVTDSDTPAGEAAWIGAFTKKVTGSGTGGRETTDGGDRPGSGERLPEFLRLMADIRVGKIQCIVVRNLDSLAADFVESAYYVQNILHYMGVRLIAVEDRFDSDREEDMKSLSTKMEDVVSIWQSNELSRRRCAEAEKRANAPDAMPSGSPPFGYNLSTEEGVKKFIVDPEIAPYVRIMFKWAMIGLSCKQIAERMRILGVPTPGQLRLGQAADPSKWEAHAVLKILENPTYTGDICLRRMKQAQYKSQARRRTSADEWVVRKNTHEPLVSREDYAAVQERLAQNYKRARKEKTS